ncbi:unnamed protein product, partial [marine sediment metagenome]
MECEVTSKTYNQIEVVPGATRLAGAVELFQKTHGFYMTALTTEMVAEQHPLGINQPMTLITEAENVKVTKNAGETWIAGDAVYWIAGLKHFSIVPGSTGVLMGKVQRAAGDSVEIGFVQMKDYYPWNGATYPVVASAPLAKLKGTTIATTGSIDLVQIELTSTEEMTAGYLKALRVTLNACSTSLKVTCLSPSPGLGFCSPS